jgi:hypothetical protein
MSASFGFSNCRNSPSRGS